MICTSHPKDTGCGNSADQIFSKLREDNSMYQGTGEPLFHENICNTLGLQSLSPTIDLLVAGAKSQCCSSMIYSHLPHD